jgi:hypothetical protein
MSHKRGTNYGEDGHGHGAERLKDAEEAVRVQ